MINKVRVIIFSIKHIIKFFFNSKKIWVPPPCATIMIHDITGADVLLPYFKNCDISIFDARGESINIYIFIKYLLIRLLKKTSYTDQYIKQVKPKILITFIDNNYGFYKFSCSHYGVTTIFIQNGIRSALDFRLLESGHDNESESLRVDYMLTFGDAIGRKYASHIPGEVISIGSIKNNYYEYVGSAKKGTVLFVSQFRQPNRSEDDVLETRYENPILWRQFYAAEAFLLPELLSYCIQNNLILQVCGCQTSNRATEEKYYKTLLGDHGWEYLEKTDMLSGYRYVDEAEIIAFIDSTLGYEALAAGKRAVAFTLRAQFLGLKDYAFGWPLELPDAGPFWTNIAIKSEISRLMKYAYTANSNEWKKNRKEYVQELMEYDFANSKLSGLLNRLLLTKEN